MSLKWDQRNYGGPFKNNYFTRVSITSNGDSMLSNTTVGKEDWKVRIESGENCRGLFWLL